MRKFASRTKVPVGQSKVEIERILLKYGATAFQYGSKPGLALIRFQMKDRGIIFKLPLPLAGRDGETDEQMQESRRRWRALVIAVKAKLEAVASGITTFEEEFYAHILLPGGKTVWDETNKAVAKTYLTGKVQPLLGEV